MFMKKIKSLTIQLFFFYSLLYCQDNNCDIMSFKIKEESFNEDIVAYYLSAIDVNSGTSYVSLFKYSIEGDNDCYQSDLSSNTDLILEFSMDIFAPSIGFNSSQNLFTGIVELSNISSIITFNNMDLDYSTVSIPGADFSLVDWNGIEIGDPSFELIKSSILSSGKIPNGLYEFNFKLRTKDSDIVDQISKTINVNEPEYIDLTSPGGAVSDTSMNVVYSTFPVFTWNTDNCSSCQMNIRVCEFNPSIHSSPTDAMYDIANLPNLDNDTYYPINDNLNSFQYPTIDSKNLEMGKLYAWQLVRTYQSTLGIQEIFSDIYIFKIFDGYNQSLDNLGIIKLLIGDQKYNELFNQGGSLSGYNELEGNIKVNGIEISMDELNQIISKIQSGIISIESIIVE